MILKPLIHLIAYLALFILGTHGSSNNGSVPTACPPRDSIAPCTCDLMMDQDDPLWSISCFGVTSQSDIDRTISVLRESTNGGRKLVIGRFFILGRNMDELDLTQFFNCTIKSLEISGFPRIHGNNNSASQGKQGIGSIEVVDLKISSGSSGMTNSGLVDVFQYFSPNLTTLAIRLNDLSSTKYPVTPDVQEEGTTEEMGSGGGGNETEFLPGFSRFIYLRELYLGYFTSPAVISGGQFKRNGNLRQLDLSQSPGLRIGPGAFVLDPPLENLTSDEYLFVNLIGNNLTETSFHSVDSQASCFHGTGRPTMLELSYNKLRFLEARHFRGFLLENEANTIDATANSFVCGDERMAWLRESRAQFRTQVSGVFCSDDPAGANVFMSNVTATGGRR